MAGVATALTSPSCSNSCILEKLQATVIKSVTVRTCYTRFYLLSVHVEVSCVLRA